MLLSMDYIPVSTVGFVLFQGVMLLEKAFSKLVL